MIQDEIRARAAEAAADPWPGGVVTEAGANLLAAKCVLFCLQPEVLSVFYSTLEDGESGARKPSPEAVKMLLGLWVSKQADPLIRLRDQL